MSYKKKPIPKSILIFGAGNHIGKPMAKFLEKEAPQIKLRLVTSRDEGLEPLRQEFPNAEVVKADYMDIPSLEAAVADMEGMYVASPHMLPGGLVTENLVAAIKKSGNPVHIIRQVAFMPEYNWRLLPEPMRQMMGGEYPDLAIKRIFEESGLPVTFINFGASFMDNLIYQMGRGIREERKMIWHPRKVPLIDPRDISEIAARLLLDDNAGHIGLLHTLTNNQDNMRYSEIPAIMTELYGEPIEYVGGKELFIKEYTPVFGPAVEFLWNFFEFESSYEEGWALNDFGERFLGRKMTTLREWLVEYKDEVLGL